MMLLCQLCTAGGARCKKLRDLTGCGVRVGLFCTLNSYHSGVAARFESEMRLRGRR